MAIKLTPSNYYSLYIEKTFQLAETIVVKSAATADAMNKRLLDYRLATVNESDLTTWKYYLNISGQYHSTDKPMTVVSMDTLETVVFSKANLLIHLATARGYVYGTRQYRELVARYPEQEMLILGILYPVSIAKAVAALDGAILSYPDGLVEPNEYSLIPKLQKWIDGFRVRWVNGQFRLSDDLYSATELAVMYANMVPALLNLRLQACKTNEAHSFHIRQYLGSHGYLDEFLDSMTISQALWFYRNISYIERNVGKRETFSDLVEHIMTARSLPLGEFVMRHDLSAQPTEVYPKPVFRRNLLNLGYSPQGTDVIDLSQMLVKEDPLARDNVKFREDLKPGILETMENSASNVVLTKVLESSVVDYENSSPYTMEETLMGHWLSLAASERYRPYIGVTNPKTGDRIPLTVKEAYVFAFYAFCRGFGLELSVIPKFYAKRVMRSPIPTASAIMQVVDASLVPLSLATRAVATMPVFTDIVSTQAFYNTCLSINKAANDQRDIVAQQQHHTRKGMVYNMMQQLWCDSTIALVPDNTLPGPWFSDRNIKISEFTTAELAVMYVEVVREATGLALTTTDSLKNLQRTMVRLLSRLTSYSVQVITEINNVDIKKTDWNTVTVGDVGAKMQAQLQWPDAGVDFYDAAVKYVHEIDYPLIPVGTHKLLSGELFHKAKLDVGELGDYVYLLRAKPFHLNFANTRYRVIPQATEAANTLPVPGMDIYSALTSEQKQSIPDMFAVNLTSQAIPYLPNLGGEITDTDLDGPANTP